MAFMWDSTLSFRHNNAVNEEELKSSIAIGRVHVQRSTGVFGTCYDFLFQWARLSGASVTFRLYRLSLPLIMESVSHLRTGLLSAIGEGGAGNEKELFDDLVECRSTLVNLYDLPPRSEAERKELQGGEHV